ncbi:MAG: sodium:proton antiporter [Oscillospiraceae bacterium]|nr:sodium:proton antiporter [Oscillospiraceae bacterium]
MDIFVIGLFCISLVVCVLFDFSIVYALLFGLCVFLVYGHSKGFNARQLFGMSLVGIKTIKNVMITLLLVGMLTGLWRAGGTLPVIISYAANIINPAYFIVIVFILNCAISLLTGTCFGTAATMGVICISIANALGIDILMTGGAILAGGYFGDRCSPVSTSALLVAQLTGSDIYKNIKNMIKTAIVPFLIACGLYIALGLNAAPSGNVPDLKSLFSKEFALTPFALVPAVVIFVLSLLRVNVKIAVTASILSSLPLCILVQNIPVADIPAIMIMGFSATNSDVAAMLDGGGLVSMLRAVSIVCISSCYSGIFQQTGLLDRAKVLVDKLCSKTTPYTTMLVTSIVAGMIACNQTLAIMLTHQLCGHCEKDQYKCALDMENTVVLTAPLIPWSIACGAALSAIEVSTACIVYAFFIYLVPLCCLFADLFKHRKSRHTA